MNSNRWRQAASSWSLGLLFVAVFGIALILTFDFPVRARTFPLFVLSAGVALSLAEIVFSFFRSVAASQESGLDIRADDDLGFFAAIRAGLPIFGWIAALFGAVYLLGATLGVPVWLTFYLLVFAKTSPGRALLTVCCLAIGMIFMFDHLMQVPWPESAVPGLQRGVRGALASIGI